MKTIAISVLGTQKDAHGGSGAAKRLFAVSRKSKKSTNDSDRLSKYLARFGLKFKDL